MRKNSVVVPQSMSPKDETSVGLWNNTSDSLHSPALDMDSNLPPLRSITYSPPYPPQYHFFILISSFTHSQLDGVGLLASNEEDDSPDSHSVV